MSLRRKRGLTFIEVMVTVVILSVGLVAVYRSFFIGLDYLNHLSYRLYALNLIESKVAFIEKEFCSQKDFDIGPLQESVVINDRQVDFKYLISLEPVGDLVSVFKLNIVLSWEERGQPKSVSRVAYFSGITGMQSGS